MRYEINISRNVNVKCAKNTSKEMMKNENNK